MGKNNTPKKKKSVYALLRLQIWQDLSKKAQKFVTTLLSFYIYSFLLQSRLISEIFNLAVQKNTESAYF